jgi:ABC-type multidrug transport system fused ATPase/permease subunit
MAPLLRAARPLARPLALLATVAALGALAEVVAAVAVVRVAGALAIGLSSIDALGRAVPVRVALVFALLALAARLAAQLAVARRASRLSARVEAEARQGVVTALMATDADAARAVSPGTLLHAATVLPNHVQQGVAALTLAATSVTGLAVSGVAALAFGPAVALALALPAATLTLALAPVRRRSARKAAERVAVEADLAERFHEVATMGREIRAFGVAGAVADALDHRIDDAARLRAATHALGRASSDLAVGVAPLVVVGAIALLVSVGPFEPTWAAAAWLLIRTAQQATQLSAAVQQAVETVPALDAIEAVRASLPAAAPMAGMARSGAWTLRGVSAGRGRLPAVDARWEAGALVVVAGPSGCGKTSLLLGLAGLLPLNGTVTIGSHDAPAEDRRASTALVPQRAALLPGTLADNVRFLRSDASDDRVRDALRDAGLPADGWREGLATHIDEATVSGGERQRIALARALLGRPAALLLDEPTSGLDAGAAEALVATVDALRRQGTLVVVVTHDPELFGSADSVVRGA